ncbi:HK97 family phage prohead protease [Mesorhizobium sp. M0496]|uniref:HK97 family phage prohead protease n=1 Tax=Mesorhizobium sp. M0496 TaxID=2956952 RepID=UPI003337A55E
MSDRLEVKAQIAVDEAGTITGLAWPFGTPDKVGDTIRKGAFRVVVDDLPMLYAHNPDDLVGTWDEVKETNEGLVVKGHLHVKESVRARAVRGLVQGGLVTGLSICFKAREAVRTGRTRVISALDLLEISLVRNPSHPRAQIISAKAGTAAVEIAEAINRATAALRSER